MRRRAWAGLAVGATATLTATALVTGTAGPDVLIRDVVTPSAAAAELTPFDGCEQLRKWYVDAALPHVTAWGLGGGPVMYAAEAASVDRDSGAAVTGDAVSNGPTGTNVQEAGVDEPDLAKTDGSLVAHVKGRQLLLTDASAERPRLLSRLRLPRAVVNAELLLVGEHLVVLGHAGGGWGGSSVDVMVDRGMPWEPMTRALVVDVSDPGAPRVEHDATFDGSLLSARQYGDVVRLVVSTSTPAIDFVQPRRGRSAREARAENRRRVLESDIEDWLPTVESDGSSSALVACGDVAHPRYSSGYGTVTVVSLDPAAPGVRRTTAVTTSSDLVYSSTDRLYLTTSRWGWWEKGPRWRAPSTAVHAFALDGLESSYVATGEVPGQLRDRWSLSEYDGRLRVATALGRDPWNPKENAVVVLEEAGTELVEVGRVGRMGIREQIQSVRWFGDVAVVVTFRQLDPLYTIDLSEPAAPRVVGALKIPGFSSYLHPVGGDLLLGLGQDADRRGSTRGAQAAVFDLADLAHPRRVDTLTFGRHTWFTAAWDSRSFTYLPDRRTAVATLSDWDGRARVVELAVGEDGGLTRRASHVVPGWGAASVRALPLEDGRVALVNRGTVELLPS